MNIFFKIFKVLKYPRTIPRAIQNHIILLYKVYILRDVPSIAIFQWFKDRGDQTLRFDYPLNSKSIVVDLGGYKGEFAYNINNRFGSYVYVFEPVKHFYLICENLFDGNSKVKVFNYGLSNENGTAYISDEDNGSSIIKNNENNCELIILKRFEEVFECLGIESIDLLKINVEGSEFDILPHLLQTGLIKKVKHLQVQFHSFYPNSGLLRDSIRHELSLTHDEMWNYPFVWESWRLSVVSP
jgi:FkbM family methyltransferase